LPVTKAKAINVIFNHFVNLFQRKVCLTLFVSITLYSCGDSGNTSPENETLPAQESEVIAPPEPEIITFVDITASSGLLHEHSTIEEENIDLFSGGLALGDVNKDGLTDIYAVGGDAGTNALFLNQGALRFEKDSVLTNIMLENVPSVGAMFADYDGDGDDDLFIGGIKGERVRLFRNNSGTFSDFTSGSGLGVINKLNNISFAFGDYDLDSDLDMFVTHRLASAPLINDLDESTQHLWRNNNDGTFTDVSLESGVSHAMTLNKLSMDPDGYDLSFTPNFADVNNDGWPDILVVADFGRSKVLINQGQSSAEQKVTFVNTTDSTQITDTSGMGSAVADFDNDGDLDWFVSSISRSPTGQGASVYTGNMFYENTGDGSFINTTQITDISIGFWAWGSCAADFNNDGFLDIFHVNGFNTQDFGEDKSRLFISQGDGSFIQSAESVGIIDSKSGRGVACFDANSDGDIDIVTMNNNDRMSFYENQSSNIGGYLTVDLLGPAPNPKQIGARIYVSAGALDMMREVSYGNNYVSQTPVEQYFGLADASLIDSVRVVWPDGSEINLKGIAINQRILIEKP
jgi:hypothetical protein